LNIALKYVNKRKEKKNKNLNLILLGRADPTHVPFQVLIVGPACQRNRDRGGKSDGENSPPVMTPARVKAPVTSTCCPAPVGGENVPLATEEEATDSDGRCGGAAQGAADISSHDGFR
jgi:hypothetical protein